MSNIDKYTNFITDELNNDPYKSILEKSKEDPYELANKELDSLSNILFGTGLSFDDGNFQSSSADYAVKAAKKGKVGITVIDTDKEELKKIYLLDIPDGMVSDYKNGKWTSKRPSFNANELSRELKALEKKYDIGLATFYNNGLLSFTSTRII